MVSPQLINAAYVAMLAAPHELEVRRVAGHEDRLEG